MERVSSTQSTLMELLKLNYLEFKKQQEEKANEFTEGKRIILVGDNKFKVIDDND